MTDYNVSDHWSADDPDWLKALVSSLDLRHGSSAVLPLTTIVSEISEWVQLASGSEAWKPAPNRNSLRLDLKESIEAIGSSLKAHIARPLTAFNEAFDRLVGSSKAVLEHPPGTRTDAVWTDADSTAAHLQKVLVEDEAVRASWDDLVAVSQDRTLVRREYRPIAELLFDQVERRGMSAEQTARDLISIVAYGRDPDDIPIGEKDTPLDDRLSKARTLVGTPADVEPTVVWLGYKGRIHVHLSAGRVSFYAAQWAIPNAQPGRFEFDHKEELWELVQHGHTFRISERVDEEDDVDTIVRVDLGVTTGAGALERAIEIVDIIMGVSIHRSGGIRPQLAEHAVLRSGQHAGSGRRAVWNRTGFANDTWGASMTAEAIGRHGPRLAEALAREELPRFLAAAVQVQTTADYPFSRDMALRKPSEADISSVVPLSDRVVQHVAAHAAMNPNELFTLLGERWAHASWLANLQRAAGMCLLGGGRRNELLNELTGEWMSDRATRPWILFLADRADDFLSLCLLEHERAWIGHMFASIGDHPTYTALINGYTNEGTVLEARRRRVRNALVHGNPASFAVVQSVREYAEFLGGGALNLVLEAFVEDIAPAIALVTRTDEFRAMQGGQDAANFWRARTAARG
ncbi:hypothetical protein [Arthrobacter sp. PM3]|uniref:hypothetical protein n=1 Tax=Arthrobacter sp. PM3 TaxID=2017685 RepID=UPI001C9AAFF3|nr:hypothetical protein [Arthrobacter sp. PM3]